MDAYEARNELRRMSRGTLFELAASQRISRCLIGGGACVFCLHYGEFSFCVSELLGQSCQVEKAESPEVCCGDPERFSCPLPFMERSGPRPLRTGRRVKNPGFRVYHRDNTTHSMILLGTVIERRNKERGNNLRDLLAKAVKDYADRVADPSTIFLLASE